MVRARAMQAVRSLSRRFSAAAAAPRLTSLRVSAASLRHDVSASPCVMTSSRGVATTTYNKPVSALDQQRSGGITTMFRMPLQEGNSEGLDVAFVGVPYDGGASNRSGTRHGPRGIRNESVMIREYNKETGAAPFDSLQVADIGDIPLTMYDIHMAARDIREAYAKHISNGCKLLALGGDHSITYPILQAVAEKYGPVGLIHIDAHKDTTDEVNGCKITHGTPFYRAWEEGLLDNKRVVQIGLRGSGYTIDNNAFGLDIGWRVVPARQCWHKSLTPLMEEVREQMGPDAPVYISFDIDGIDPAFAPGTGTPEIGGLTTIQALEIIWGCKGLNVVGGDLVEVSPPFDTTGTTSLIGANLLFEMLCILPGVQYHQIPV